MNLGAPELIIVALVVVLLFGGAALPKLARGMGQAQREFKKGLSEDADAHTTSDAKTPPKSEEES